MIPAKDGHVAIYNRGTTGVHTRPIVAWNNDGEPLVVGDQGLVTAWSLAGYNSVSETPAPVPVTAVPGGGWLIDCVDDDGNTWTDAIVAWVVHSDGSLVPLGTDQHGVTGDATEGLADYRLYHPDGTLREQLGPPSKASTA